MVSIKKDIFIRLKESVQFFDSFSDEELLAFLRIMKSEQFLGDEIIFNEFDPGEKMYIILSGQVVISKRIGKKEGIAKETTLAILGPGECFGEMGLIDKRPRSAKATSQKNSFLFSISDKTLFRVSNNPSYSRLASKLYKNFSVMLAKRLRESNQKFVDLSSRY